MLISPVASAGRSGIGSGTLSSGEDIVVTLPDHASIREPDVRDPARRRPATISTVLRPLVLVALVAASAAAGACSKTASHEGEAKQWAESPPPKEAAFPTTLEIAVIVDGAPRPPITGETLKTTKPDFSDDERKAWRVPTLVAEAGPAGTVEASSPAGVSVKFTHPTPEGLEPVLFLTRRGEVIVAAVDPKDPFPRYHGQGGRLHRAGDQMPRVAPVAKLEITRAK